MEVVVAFLIGLFLGSTAKHNTGGTYPGGRAKPSYPKPKRKPKG